jgi:cell division protein FtsQ
MTTGSSTNVKIDYKQIELTGNELLPAGEYLRFARLSDSKKYNGLTLLEVKTRLEKHPYLRKAEVEFDGINTILVEVKEKEIKAVLLQKNALKMVTDDKEILPLFPPTNIKELPLISNVKLNGKQSYNDANLDFAFRIIDAISLSDTNVRKNLAEINLRNGKDVILTFTGLNCPVLFGKCGEVKKALMLKELWLKKMSDEDYSSEIEYIDLRYTNKIFIGKRNTESISG